MVRVRVSNPNPIYGSVSDERPAIYGSVSDGDDWNLAGLLLPD